MSGISVLISTYHGEDADDVDRSLKTTYNQSLQPDEVVIVEDGQLPSDNAEIIDSWRRKYPNITNVVSFDENRGTGAALRAGLSECTEDIIAKVDSDDYSELDRFSKQFDYLLQNKNVDAVGAYMEEILPDGTTATRTPPADPGEIESYAVHRSPINHPTAMYRRNAVEAVGGYRNLRSMQDYDLWVRLLNAGHKLANIPEILVRSEVSEDYFTRRGGVEYLSIELRLMRSFWRMGFLSTLELIKNVALKTPVRVVPNSMRKRLYMRSLRD